MLYQLPIAFGKDLICYNSVEINYDEDVSIMFDYHTQFLKIRIMKLFVVVGESVLSFRGFAPDPAFSVMSLSEHSPTFAIASPMETKIFK